MAITTAPFTWYDSGLKHLSLPNLLTDDIKVALCTSGYVPNAASHEFFDVSVTNELATANGYTAGGLSLTTKAINSGTNPGEWEVTSDDPSWTATGGSITARLFVLYNNTPASNKPLIGYGYLNWNNGTPLDVSIADTYQLAILIPTTGWFYTQKTDGAA
ncbi:MAG: hypothetical protein M8364_16610 [Methylobacter sp.]|uniref:hypothetical protein n=1 Tax=Methylobacter sp. TaxID=2051955 RepID=UPI00258C435C|nr:hypothetical protein [Methylobacter sp.]MCL7422514.1 hypothetical protein [Methylobacter sp.]